MVNFLLALLHPVLLMMGSEVLVEQEPPVYSNLVRKETITVYPDFSYQQVIEKKLRLYSQDGLKHACSNCDFL